MKPADYKCIKCEYITVLWIKNDEEFPKYYSCMKCGNKARRVYSPAFTICHQGKCGNSNNGYTSNLAKVKKT